MTINYEGKLLKRDQQIETLTQRNQEMAEKSAQVSASRTIYPDGIEPKACEIQRHQYVWRIIDGKRVVRYFISIRINCENVRLCNELRATSEQVF